MKIAFKVALIILLFLAACATDAMYLTSHSIAVLDPRGIIGEKERDLIITACLLMLIVVIPVFALTLAFAWIYRENNPKAQHLPDWEHNYIAEYCWWGVPVFIIAILAVITWKSSHELNPFKPIASEKKTITIQAVALQWKWLFIYPEEGIAAINFVQFPEKTPVHFEITSDAPMNSFWIPQLGGQIYAMPAMRSSLYLIANEQGDFRGCSANISGAGFAGMKFIAKSSSEEEFAKWVESVKQSAKILNLDEYQLLLTPTEYAPVSYYAPVQQGLFDQIIMKYMSP